MNERPLKGLWSVLSIMGLTTCAVVDAQTTITLQPGPSDGLDASIAFHTNYDTENTNFGDDIWFKAYCIPGYSGGENTNRGLIDFDLSGIPAGATITSAQLYLYAAGYVNNLIPGHFGSNAAYIERVTSPWTEYGVTWNSSATSTAVNQVIVPASSSSTEDYVVDVAALVQDMVIDPDGSHGFLLRQQVENPFNPSCLVFHSSDEADPTKHPKLVVTYTEATTLCIQPDPNDGKDASPSYHTSYNTENTNFGDDTRFKAFCIPGAMGGANTARGLLEFELLPLPPGAELLSAQLSLFASGYVNDLIPGHFGNNAAWLKRVIEPWSELSVTWGTQPLTASADEVLVQASSSSTEDYLIDVTGLVNASLADPVNSHGFMFGLLEENPDDQACLVFWSSDASDPLQRPKLCLTYALDGATGRMEIGERKDVLDVFPDPTDGLFTIRMPGSGSTITAVQVIGSLGEVVHEWRGFPLRMEPLTFEFPDVASGRYTLRIVGPDMIRFTPVVLLRR